MKRDLELIKKILLKIESFPEFKYQQIEIEGYTQQELSYHINLLLQANLIEAKGSIDLTYRVKALTWEGHEFLDASKNENVWKKAKQIIIDKGGSISLEVLKALLQQLLLKNFIS